ncbi:HAD family hydrolase [Poritiphilus flavus]|uniref:phosphoglycolate phosphatase n=1 Tax=Poritiphilus flavus TaxID=2697053 RepID=A0A6L9EEY3_9FLAO|nr:HAD family phosphatase [Poritiphilus flavus]NAS13297.1 HAD-IA family hydrolase [Poritiphilus flavus]
MIKAVIFDLDGTLIQTEVLKATSYARAIELLTQGELPSQEVLDSFGQFVGLSRTEVVRGLSEHFASGLRRHLRTDDLELVGQKLISKRLELYREMLEDVSLLSQHFCPFTLGLFHQLQTDGFQVVLATMSHLPEAKRITTIMEIYHKFDLVLTRDDVQQGKPDPEIYNLARTKLGLATEECLVIEDSVNGIKAAQNAKIPVFAVTNDVTRESVHDCGLLDAGFVVDNLEDLSRTVYSFIDQQKSKTSNP